RLVELHAQALRRQPRRQVGDSGRRGRNDHPDRARGEGLRRSRSRKRHAEGKSEQRTHGLSQNGQFGRKSRPTFLFTTCSVYALANAIDGLTAPARTILS